MTFRAQQYSIGTAAAAIATATAKNIHEITMELGANKNIWVGGAAVTTTTGFEISKGAITTLKIGNGDVLYAISDGADTVLDVYDFQVDP
jgi:hypothetical protein